MQLRSFFGADALAGFGFALWSPGRIDNAQLETRYAGKNPKNANCGGENISPALAWARPPAATPVILWPHSSICSPTCFTLPEFTFASGERLADVRLHYVTLGTPRRDAAGVVRNVRSITSAT